MFDIQFEMVASVVDATHAFLLHAHQLDVPQTNSFSSCSALATSSAFTIDQRTQLHLLSRKLIGFINFVLSDVFPSWSSAPLEILTHRLFSASALAVLKRWLQAFALYNCALITFMEYSAAPEESADITLVHNAGKMLATSRHLLKDAPPTLELHPSPPVSLTPPLVVLHNICAKPLLVDGSKKEASPDDTLHWHEAVFTLDLLLASVYFQAGLELHKSEAALQLANNNGNMWIADELKTLHKRNLASSACPSIPSATEILAEVKKFFFILKPTSQFSNGIVIVTDNNELSLL
jgi:hypothetical protein